MTQYLTPTEANLRADGRARASNTEVGAAVERDISPADQDGRTLLVVISDGTDDPNRGYIEVSIHAARTVDQHLIDRVEAEIEHQAGLFDRFDPRGRIGLMTDKREFHLDERWLLNT